MKTFSRFILYFGTGLNFYVAASGISRHPVLTAFFLVAGAMTIGWDLRSPWK